MVKIAFFNNKGGVGKSTAAINVAYAMSCLGKRVLVIDCDSQMNTFRFFADEPEYSYSGDTRYEAIDVELLRDKRIYYSSELDTGVDYELWDMPPALDEAAKNALSLCDYVFVPIELGTFAIQGIAKVTEAIAETGAKFGGCFVNKFDRDNPADRKLDEFLRNELGNNALKARIPYSRVIKNSISFRQTAFEYAGKSKAAKTYAELTREILEICVEER